MKQSSNAMSFYLLIFITVIINMGAGVIIPLMPIMLKKFGFTSGSLSLAFFALLAARFLAQNVGGALLARFSTYRLLLTAMILYVLTMAAYPLVDSKWLFILFRFFEGIVEGLAVLCLNDLAIEFTTKENRGKRMGLFGSSFALGFILGPLLGGLLYGWGGMSLAFWGTGSLALIGVAMMVFTFANFPHRPKAGGKQGWLFQQFKGAYLALLPLYSPQILRRVLFFSFQMILPLALHERFGVPAAQVGIFFAFSAILATILMPSFGKLADKTNNNMVLSIGLVTMGVSIFFFGIVQTKFMFLVMYAIETLAFCMMLPTAMKFFGDKVADREDRGAILGSFGSLVDLSSLLVPFVVFPLYNYHAMLPWAFLGGLCVLAALPFLLEMRREAFQGESLAEEPVVLKGQSKP